MSFGSESGRTRSGTKGFSNKEKKQKRKKQEFHSHKRAYLQGGERADPEAVRARTVLALDRLGYQVLSTEPGGYDLEDWSRNFNALLDDFEEKVGPASITDEFRARRQEVVGYLVPSATADDIDSEIERLTEEERDARALLDEVEKKAADRLVALREERDECARDLRAQRDRLSELTEARQSRQFFSRLLRSAPSTEDAQANVRALESKLAELEQEIERSRKARATAERDGSGEKSSYLEAQKRLEDARTKLLELQIASRDKSQLKREREIATQTISAIISSMRLHGATQDETGTQAQ